MSTESDLKAAARKVARVRAALRKAEAGRDAVVVQAIAEGMTHRSIAAAAELSAGRPAQIAKNLA